MADFASLVWLGFLFLVGTTVDTGTVEVGVVVVGCGVPDLFAVVSSIGKT